MMSLTSMLRPLIPTVALICQATPQDNPSTEVRSATASQFARVHTYERRGSLSRPSRLHATSQGHIHLQSYCSATKVQVLQPEPSRPHRRVVRDCPTSIIQPRRLASTARHQVQTTECITLSSNPTGADPCLAPANCSVPDAHRCHHVYAPKCRCSGTSVQVSH